MGAELDPTQAALRESEGVGKGAGDKGVFNPGVVGGVRASNRGGGAALLIVDSQASRHLLLIAFIPSANNINIIIVRHGLPQEASERVVLAYEEKLASSFQREACEDEGKP